MSRVLFITHYSKHYGANNSLLALLDGLVQSEIKSYGAVPIYGELINELEKRKIDYSYFLKGIKKRRIIIHFNYHETKFFLKISLYQVGGQIVNYVNRDLDILLVGKFFGSEILGG